ncbi:hypothetical protein HOY34_07160 [Xinfangfangia sp. D13-10-4-6]|uniref:hypothetical protein n=1 Tax=Pseudogemmobacter hezensis TaxID=2737662 RepID=UPI0015539600|nr:hypothetical protein [Pseudogemmobacter hezensis]NPD14983.1 hypothetical protein [Pseudogemmobacter hezensis]
MYRAYLSAKLGLPYAFASHFAPHILMNAIMYYRENFWPSVALAAPYVIAGDNAFVVDTEAKAALLVSSHFHWVNMLYKGRPGPLPYPNIGYLASLSDHEKQRIQQALAYSIFGDKTQGRTVAVGFTARTGADELILGARIHNPAARCRSSQLLAEALSCMMVNSVI